MHIQILRAQCIAQGFRFLTPLIIQLSDETFFDSPRFSVSRLTHVLKAKAVLCPGVEITFKDEINNTEQRWCYQDGLNDYLAEAVNGLLAQTGTNHHHIGPFQAFGKRVHRQFMHHQFRSCSQQRRNVFTAGQYSD